MSNASRSPGYQTPPSTASSLHPYDIQNALRWDIDILVNNAAIAESGPITGIQMDLLHRNPDGPPTPESRWTSYTASSRRMSSTRSLCNGSSAGSWGPTIEKPDWLSNTLLSQEKTLIEAAFAKSRGKVAGANCAAAKLGIPASTLESKIRLLKIEKRKFTVA